MNFAAKMLARRPGRTDGFSIVETLAAVAMLTFIGIIGSRALLSSMRSIATTRYHQKACTLGEMVLQQYTSYAAQDYKNLGANDVGNPPSSPQPASVFFHRSDNLGFDRMGITSHTDYAADLSTASVTVTISWNEGSAAKSYSFIKTFAPRTTLLGGTLQVYVKVPCDDLTDPAAIIATCPGLANFSVNVPGFQGSIPTQFTDTSGATQLIKNVAVGSSIGVTIRAPVPSSYTISYGTPGFQQGYYALDPSRNLYSIVETTPTNVSAGALTTLVVTNFLEAGTLHGTVTNNSSVSPTPSLDGMQIEIHSGRMASPSGSYSTCTYAYPCTVFSQGGGLYTFNNVMAASYTYTVWPIGTPGSSPEITPASSGFAWGCVRDPSKNPSTAYVIHPADWGTNLNGQPDVSMPVYFVVMGWLNATLTPRWIPQAAGPMTILINDTTNPFPMRNPPPPVPAGLDMWSNPGPTPTIPSPSGTMVAYNLIAADPLWGDTHFWNVPTAPSGPNPSFYLNDNWGKSAGPLPHLGQENDFSLPVEPSYTLSGTIVEKNGLPLNTIKMTGWGFYNPAFGSAINQVGNRISLNPDGTFTYPGYFPVKYKSSDLISTDPQGGFKAAFVFTDTTTLNSVTVGGSAIDAATGGHAGGAPVKISTGGVNGFVTLWTDSSGALSAAQPVQVPYNGVVDAWVVCNDANLTCTLCDPPTPPSTLCAAPQLTIDKTKFSVRLLSSLNVSPGYFYEYDLYEPVASNIMSTPTPISMLFGDQLVSGVVTDQTGKPIAGIKVPADPTYVNQSVNTITNSAGQFGPLWVHPNPSDPRTSSSPGGVELDLSAQLGYADPPPWTQSLGVDADPLIPISATIPLSPDSSLATAGGL